MRSLNLTFNFGFLERRELLSTLKADERVAREHETNCCADITSGIVELFDLFFSSVSSSPKEASKLNNN